MRYLNRIIFINSAHVPYAEIKLDGNVHFIGTQGVGKSTLLRAILFFYNGDKSKLGIRTQDKQKSYDEFYLPYPNSYIIYEVCRETGTFFVMTFLSRGRTAFRMVDCPYDKHFFVEEDGSVGHEWGKISERIGAGVFRSNIIRGYEEFRDIIYGNQQNVAKDLRKFSLLESTKYQNVPRTIQNIFLNQSLESRVIKDTIIDSMDFAGDSIDLNFFRDKVKDFRQQYDDIWKWYKMEKNGRVKVQVEADNVISKYTLYEYTRKTIAELCGNLNYALERDTERLPHIEREETACGEELARQRRLLSEEEGKHNAERDKLNQEDGALKAFLDKTKDKRRHYEEIGIGHIIERIEKEGELHIRQDSMKQEIAVLTDKHTGVTQRYDALRQEVDNQLREFNIRSGQKLNALERELTENLMRMQAEQSERQETVRIRYQQKLDENQDKMQDTLLSMNDLKVGELKIAQLNPYKEAMEELEKRIRELNDRQNELSRVAEAKQREIDKVMHDTDLQRNDMKNACDKDMVQIEHEIQSLLAEIAKCDELLSRQKGSLIEWLGEHVDGWEADIGKVLDRDAVLYNTALNPRQAETSDTLYGVKIDVENIEKTVETPEEIKSQKAMLEQKVDDLRKQKEVRKLKLDADIDRLELKPQARLKTLRKEKMNVDAECNQIPLRIQTSEKELNGYEDRLTAWRKSEQAALQQRKGEIEKTIEELKRQKQSLVSQKAKELEGLKRGYDKQRKDASAEFEQKKKSISTEITQKEKEASVRINELDALCDAELKGLGVDVNQLETVRRQLQSIVDELAFVVAHRSDYISWQNDTKEYFEREQTKKEERKQIKQKIEDLQEKFRLRKQKLDHEIAGRSSELRALQDEQKKLREAIDSVKSFMATSSCPTEMLTVGKLETAKPLAAIQEELRDNISSRQHKLDEFRQAVNAFKCNFSPQNTFHFRTEFNTDTDYIEFAAELNDFLSNKKIEEYRVRTSAQYAGIIQQIAKEVGDLSRHNADVRATINDINKDFRENNFAGVIKDIELRAVESNDRLMQQLLNIKKFDDDHGFEIGELDLFSDRDNLNRINRQAVDMLMTLIDRMDVELKRDRITLADTFKLEFKVKENDNDTNWVEKLSSVGSDGTDILVKAMVNIMLINVFKRKISRKFGDFKLHCMMDEIGKLHPNNVEGILKFANVRNIYLINSSPTTYNAQAYKYTYMLSKDERSNTVIKTLLTIR